MKAREARREWLSQAFSGVDHRVSELIRHLHSVRRAEQVRLLEVRNLVSDFEGQLTEVSSMETSMVRKYSQFLFFELAKLRAEKAYLEGHLAELDKVLGKAAP
jgi:hypothetical protein